MFFDKWLGGKYALYKQDRKNSSVYNICCIFEDNYIFVDNFILILVIPALKL